MEIVLAVGVLVVLGVAIVGVVRWARGGAAYDDATGGLYVPSVPEPSGGHEPEDREHARDTDDAGPGRS